MTVSFDCTRAERTLVLAIVKRAAKDYQRTMGKRLPDPLSLQMDLIACHANGCPLDFQRILDADDFNFAHDVFGISRHINRETGELQNCFLPRMHRRDPVAQA